MMDQVDLKEKYDKSLDTIRELKKQNNNLQDTVKKLKARSRWPEHVQAAVLSKEGAENCKMMKAQLEELSNQCSVYEQQIDLLKSQRANKTELKPVETPKSTRADEAMLARAVAQIATLQATQQKTTNEWREQDKAYKQQVEELVSRLVQTEERLTQVLRLRTLDSAELIRLARASKISAAQLTTLQDENQRTRLSLEQAQARAEELGSQLVEAQQRVLELQEEASQAQVLRQTLQDLLQELEDLKQEQEVLRGHLKTVTTEASKLSPASEDLEGLVSELQDTLAREVAQRQKLERMLTSRQELGDVRQKLEAERQQMKDQLAAMQAQLRNVTEAAPLASGVLPSEISRKKVEEKAVQTVNMDLNFKPPEVTCMLSGEESDRALAHMYSEIESHRELVRTQTHLTNLLKNEMEALHKQLKCERAQYAAELAHKMTRLQELQSMLQVQMPAASPSELPPKPAPRSLSKADRHHHHSSPVSELAFTEFDLKLVSVCASEDSPLLSSTKKFFFEISLLPLLASESVETPGHFSMLSVPYEQVPLDHELTWRVQEEGVSEALHHINTRVHFALVGEPTASAGDVEDEDCEELGSGEVFLSEWKGNFNSTNQVDVPIKDPAGCVIGSLRVKGRFV